jgi:hypothetical protein
MHGWVWEGLEGRDEIPLSKAQLLDGLTDEGGIRGTGRMTADGVPNRSTAN